MKRLALAFAACILALAPSDHSLASVEARISLAQQRMEVHVDGKLTHTWAVSTGREGYDTPTGTYTPYWLSRDHRSQKYDDAPMPFAVFFKGGYAVHGTTSLGMLGRRASHGCVRLSPANARHFFELVQQHGLSGSKVVIHDAPARSERQLLAEIGVKREKRLEPAPKAKRAQTAQNRFRVVPNAYGPAPALATTGRHYAAPVFVYQIGPQGQMIPVQRVVYPVR